MTALGWPSARGQIHEASLPRHVEPAAVLQRIFVEKVSYSRDLDRHLFERVQVDFHVKVAAVGKDCAVAHLLHVVAVEDMNVAGRGAEDVADLGRAGHWHYLEAVHDRFQRPAGDRLR